MPKSPQRIAIVGGGFSGVMTAVNLARFSTHPLEITVINRGRPAGRGVAYGTRHPEHLLNVAVRSSTPFRKSCCASASFQGWCMATICAPSRIHAISRHGWFPIRTFEASNIRISLRRTWTSRGSASRSWSSLCSTIARSCMNGTPIRRSLSIRCVRTRGVYGAVSHGRFLKRHGISIRCGPLRGKYFDSR
jgi:hypothetical protein